MSVKNKSDLIMEFLSKCKEREDLLCRTDAMTQKIDDIEESIKDDVELIGIIKTRGVSFLDEVVRYCPDMECLRIDAAPVVSINLTDSLSFDQLEALSVER